MKTPSAKVDIFRPARRRRACGGCMNLFDLRGKTAVVSGASGAIGGALAEGLAHAGADVVLCYGRNKDRAEALKAKLEDAGVPGRVVASRVDANDAEAVRDHAARVMAEFGHVDVLVLCAGGNVAAALTGGDKTFFDLELEPLREVMDLNFFGGCIYPCLYYGREMVKNADGGSIITISSMNAYRPLLGRPGYAAAKAAVTNFTQWLATHMALECHSSVRVNAIAPGFVPNARMRVSLFNEDGSRTERGERILSHTPMGRLGTPEDLIGTCIWYASDASRYVTGTVTPVDGGFHAFSGV